MDRQIIRMTAERVLRGDDLIADEKQLAAAYLHANPSIGNPHGVRCDWCHAARTLFRDENDGPFVVISNGWRCATCDTRAANQEIRF